MRHSRPEVARWRMLRQATRRRRRWLESQSRRNIRIFALRKLDIARQRRSLLFAQAGLNR
ncbi:YciY family protein [Morganella sp. GD04133]|uniref:YciY family protein n=1 Tax=Morganella TaxID=581 RepID=UPI00244B6D65|nr:YciY family protein [Morganella sp. GD04133]MDH0354588.1 YciY family protein [Morganella sp. GD04133]